MPLAFFRKRQFIDWILWLFVIGPQENPETRTDLEASITGEGTENLYVVEVIKPIVRIGDKSFSRVVQKGIVIVQSKEADLNKGAENV